MRASAIEFRLRVAIIFVVIWIGFWAPWIEPWGSWPGLGRRISLLEWLALELSRLGVVPFSAATPLVIVIACLTAAVAVVLRVWGTAYLGTRTVHNAEMKAGTTMADGPYRYVRNPLYLGTWFMVAAMAFIMPASGAVFVMVLLTVFLLRLILGEEAFLTGQLGQPYQDYLRAVPRLIPRLRSNLSHSGVRPHWGQAALAEFNPIGVFVTLAVFSWSYDNWLVTKALLIAFGVSMLVRSAIPRTPQQVSQPQ
jgi:protein-S-isoprenylcysteine O-methyltransferase Ste14